MADGVHSEKVALVELRLARVPRALVSSKCLVLQDAQLVITWVRSNATRVYGNRHSRHEFNRAQYAVQKSNRN